MGKRKVAYEPPAAAAGAAAAARPPPIMVLAKLRERSMRWELLNLNTAFAQYVDSHVNADFALTDAVDAYLKYMAGIQARYADVLAPRAAPRAARRRHGAVYMVGAGDYGQLGLGQLEDGMGERTRPVLLDGFGGRLVSAVACGGMHTLALTEDGGVWSWGVNDEGPLGRELPADPDSAGGANQTGWEPRRVPMPADAQVCALSAGDSHSVALTTEGRVFAWGTFRDKSGVMGFSPTVRMQSLPALVFAPATPSERVTAIASGVDHVLLLCADGSVRSFGCAEKGRLGRFKEADADIAVGDLEASARPPLLRRLLQPEPIPGLSQVVSISAGSFSSFAITKRGEVYAWGLNNYGQLTIPEAETRTVYEPRRVPLLEGLRVKFIVSGQHHTLVVTEDGKLYAFGRPTYGRLGVQGVNVSSDDAVHEPREVTGFGDDPVVAAAAGLDSSAAVTASGAVYVWGCNNTAMLGKGDEDSDEVVPRRLKPSKTFPAAGGIAVSLGGQHAAWLAAPPADALLSEGRAEKMRRTA